jgi:hypothetical protein
MPTIPSRAAISKARVYLPVASWIAPLIAADEAREILIKLEAIPKT